jgi:hypothetical protein
MKLKTRTVGAAEWFTAYHYYFDSGELYPITNTKY